MKKLTITVSDEVYAGLHSKIGQGGIGRFLDSLARPHVVDSELDEAYRQMALDSEREAEALVWVNNLTGDAVNDLRVKSGR